MFNLREKDYVDCYYFLQIFIQTDINYKQILFSNIVQIITETIIKMISLKFRITFVRIIIPKLFYVYFY
jgi:ssDNA-specific exonuclease RecJ